MTSLAACRPVGCFPVTCPENDGRPGSGFPALWKSPVSRHRRTVSCFPFPQRPGVFAGQVSFGDCCAPGLFPSRYAPNFGEIAATVSSVLDGLLAGYVGEEVAKWEGEQLSKINTSKR